MPKLPRLAALLAALLLTALLPAVASAAEVKATAKPGGAPAAQRGPAIGPVVPPKAAPTPLAPAATLGRTPSAAPADLDPRGRTVQPAGTRNTAFWSWGVTKYQSGLNCSIIDAPYYETQVTSQVGYGGTPGVPKVGDRFNVVLLYSHPGYACSGGFLADVYSELELPDGAALAIDQNHGIQCFTNTRSNPDTYVDVTNSTWSTPNGLSGRWCDTDGGPGKYGAIGLGMRLMATGTIFQIVVPVVATKELKGAAHVPEVARFLSVTESAVTLGNKFPEVWANVLGYYAAEITHPTPSATDITQTTAKTHSTVYTHYKGGTAYIDFGETTAYGTSTEAIALPAGADWYTLTSEWGELVPGRTYHWRARFVGSDGAVTNGPDQTFTTAPDLQPPDTTLNASGPSGSTQSRTASFAFTASEAGASFECKLDTEAWAACASPKAYAGPLATGTHTFAVRAKDAAGNADPTPAIRTWTVVDAPAPAWARPLGLNGVRAGSAVRGDFNGDGRSDLAVGVPGEHGGAGAVQVFNGSTTGLTATGSKLIDQDTPYVGDAREAGDGFGSSLVAGDFNGDGKADLAVAAPGEDVGTITDAGVLHVLLGRSTGLSGTGSQTFSQNSSNVADAAEAGDRFGTALAAGDFGGDGKADLAVGVPAEGLGTATGAGVVHVLVGAAAGLTAGGSQYWSQNSTDVADASQAGDGFGATLSAADVGGGTQADLIVGVPAEDAGALTDTGMVHVLLGSAANLTADGNQALTQDSAGIADQQELGDGFGAALAAGDFTGDGRADVAIGTPAEDLGTAADAGAVQILPGSDAGAIAAGSQFWYQNSGGISDDAEAGDRFGAALVAGNLGGDAKADLAVGAPGEDAAAVADTGAVHALLGTTGGLSATGSRYYTQDSTQISDTAEAGDRFGAALTAADLGGTALDDLVVGVPAEDLGTIADAGVVQVLPGAATGPTATGSQIWGQGSADVAEDPEAGDGFGSALGR